MDMRKISEQEESALSEGRVKGVSQITGLPSQDNVDAIFTNLWTLREDINWRAKISWFYI